MTEHGRDGSPDTVTAMRLPSAADLAPDIAARTEHATERLRELPGSSDDFRPAGVDAIREAGLHRLMLPAADGGQGAGMRDAVEVLAAIAAVDASLALGLAMQTQVLGAAVETRGWPEAPLRRLVAAVRRRGRVRQRRVHGGRLREPGTRGVAGDAGGQTRRRDVSPQRREDVHDVASGTPVRPRQRAAGR